MISRWFHEYGTFWLFAGCCLVGFFFIAVAVPETKGKTLEEIELYFSRPRTPAKVTGSRRSRAAAVILRRRRKSSSVALASGVAGIGGNSTSSSYPGNSSSSNESLPDVGLNVDTPYPTTLPTVFGDNKLVGFRHNFDSAY
jgi:hypothetical protein